MEYSEYEYIERQKEIEKEIDRHYRRRIILALIGPAIFIVGVIVTTIILLCRY